MKELKSIFYCIIIIPIHSELGNDFAKQTLKHPNINVFLVHPDGYYVTQNTFNLISRLSHNEKIVDQSIAFIGGIDLGFDRWDNHKHELTLSILVLKTRNVHVMMNNSVMPLLREGSCISAGSAKIIAIHFKLGTILGLIIHWRITWTGQKFLECHFMMLVVHFLIVQLEMWLNISFSNTMLFPIIIDCI